MKTHPAAAALPEMQPGDYEALKTAIEKHGLLFSLKLCDGKLIDGRHRLRACEELDVEPRWSNVELNGLSPAEYVWDVNGARRHLTPSQRAAVAVELLPELKAEAKKRLATSTGGAKARPQEKIPEAEKGQARDQAAAIVGVNPHYVSDAETLKQDDQELFDQVKCGDVTLSKAKKQFKTQVKAESDSKASANACRVIASQNENGVYHGDSFELAKTIPDESCALIFTDPPYDHDSVYRFWDLGLLASRILVDGGSLVTFCGQYVLREVIEAVAPEYSLDDVDAGKDYSNLLDDEGDPVCNQMKLFWIACCLHSGPSAQMREYGIKVKWKPMLWFVKGKFRRDRETWIDDLVDSRQEKDLHPWQQSMIEARHFIDRLTVLGELVADPFCGSGTTAMAAKESGRKWWTADIDERCVETARKRLA